MIKTGIIGAEHPEAGELLRLLSNHPEVDLKALYSPDYAGRTIAAVHYGFIGEPMLSFTDRINPEELDIVFITDDSALGLELLQNSVMWPNLKIVDMSPERFDHLSAFGMEYGLSEINRKPMVRGARMAVVPSSSGALSLSAIYPLLSHIQTDEPIEIEIEAPSELAKCVNRDVLAREIESQLIYGESSLDIKVALKVLSSERQRSLRVKCRFNSRLTPEEAASIYEAVYDDHNFTFVAMGEVDSREVEGTHKNILWITKPSSGELMVSGVADCHLRGYAGDAVHILNLLFALDEKVGLTLKPVCYGTKDSQSDNQTCWFA